MDRKQTDPSWWGRFWGTTDSEAQRLKICLLSVFIMGLMAHGYGFLNFTVSHDSLWEFRLPVSAAWKVSLGRFMEPLLRYLMGEVIVLPWLTGVTGLLFLGLAVHLISKMFSLNGIWENVLLAGVCVTNVTVTAMAATYLHDFAGDMLALLLSVCAAFAWAGMRDEFSWRRTALGGVCLGASFGFYQAYLAVMLTLLGMRAILDLLNGDRAGSVLRRLLWAAPMGLLAVAIYAAGVLVCLRLFGAVLSGDEGNNLSYIGSNLQRVAALIKEGYYWVIGDILIPNDTTVHSVFRSTARLICLFNLVLLLVCAATVFAAFRKRAMKLPEILLTLVLTAVLPACMICVGFVSTVFHNLTRWAVCLYYLMVLLIFRYGRETSPGQWRKFLPAGMIAVVLLNNLAVANTAYEKKDLERQAMMSTMTRALTLLEQREDYVPGESQIDFAGILNMYQPGLEAGDVPRIVGLKDSTQITHRDALQAYFDLVLQYPVNLCSRDQDWNIRQTEEFQAMSSFPDKNCVAKIDGVIVVKMSGR